MQMNSKLLLGAILQLSVACTAGAEGKVTEVSTRQLAGGLAVHIGGKNLSLPTTKWDDGAIVLRFDAVLETPKVILRPNKGGIVAITWWQNGTCVGVVIRPSRTNEPKIAKMEDGWLVSFSESPTNTTLTKPAAPKPPKATRGPNDASSATGDVLCSLQVTAMDPAQILQTLSAQTHANLVLLSTPETNLTIRLSHVPLSEMIRHICAMCDLSFLCIGKTYVIATPDRLKKAYPIEWDLLHPPTPAQITAVPERATETYSTGFVTAAEMTKSLEKLYTGKDIAFVAGPGSINPEVGTQDGSKATGTTTTMLTKDAAADSVSRTVLITGQKDLVTAALAMAKQLDQPRQQVSIAVTIHDISNDDLHDLGITWNFGNLTFQEGTPNGVNFGTFTRTPLSIATTLNALDKTGRSKLLASPNVSVLDGERAFVLIGERISYPVLIGYSQSNAPIFSKEEQRVGIYLQVSASIGHDGAVTLNLYPQVSTITGYLTVNGASYPQIATREAETTLMVTSGETIVMGGLFSDEEIGAIEKVPFLSQIPILGEIFKHRKVTKTKSQVIITVTPTILGRKKQ